MNKCERIRRTCVKLKQRKSLMDNLGMQGGTLYAKHRDKISSSLGYMRDGNVSHYVSVGYTKKYDRNALRKHRNLWECEQ